MSGQQGADWFLPQSPRRHATRSHPASSDAIAGESPSPRILVVQQVPSLALIDLKRAGYRVEVVERDDDAAARLRDNPPDLLILDAQAGDTPDGDFCARVRTFAGQSPVLILALVGDEAEGVRSLAAGADDFIVNPVSATRLLPRIHSLLRRARPGTTHQLLRAGDLQLDPDFHRASRAGRPLRLSPTEYRLLKLFLGCPGQVWSREQLLAEVWGPKARVGLRTVDIWVSRLRKVLNRGARTNPLRTARGVGYVLTGDRASSK